MKIYVDGSQRSAVRRMFPVWANLGHIVASNPKEADIQLSTVKISKKTGLPVVLRLDGVYYDKACNYTKRNKHISMSHVEANGIVYQSNMSKMMCEKYLSERETKHFSIIHNGIDDTWNKPVKHTGINVVACSKWRRPKRLKETIQVFKFFKAMYGNCHLHIIGPLVKGQQPIEADNVHYWGKVDHERMKNIYRQGDLYLHLCKKDSCPSTVVEAIGAGIPVITTDACGGATEMCQLTDGCSIIPGDLKSIDPDYIYQDRYNQLPKKVVMNLVESMLCIAKEKRRVILPKELKIETCAQNYLQLMNQVLR